MIFESLSPPAAPTDPWLPPTIIRLASATLTYILFHCAPAFTVTAWLGDSQSTCLLGISTTSMPLRWCVQMLKVPLAVIRPVKSWPVLRTTSRRLCFAANCTMYCIPLAERTSTAYTGYCLKDTARNGWHWTQRLAQMGSFGPRAISDRQVLQSDL